MCFVNIAKLFYENECSVKNIYRKCQIFIRKVEICGLQEVRYYFSYVSVMTFHSKQFVYLIKDKKTIKVENIS